MENCKPIYLFDKFVKVFGLNVDNDVRGAAEFDFFDQIDPLVHIGAQLPHLQTKLVVLDKTARQANQILNAMKAVGLLVEYGHIFPLVVADQVDY